MLQFFWNLCRSFAKTGASRPDWCSDPLSHPALKNMDARMIADLPMPRLPAQACRECAPQKNGT